LSTPSMYRFRAKPVNARVMPEPILRIDVPHRRRASRFSKELPASAFSDGCADASS
jgi:hypothetical protein